MKPKLIASNAIDKNDHSLNAAWHFAQSALWPNQVIQQKEITSCKEFIRHFFQLQINNETALIVFCERILLAKEYYQRRPDQLPQPQCWFNHKNDDGFISTLTSYHQLLARRQQVSDFRKDLQIVTDCYLQYILNPSEQPVKECARKLLALRADDLLQVFYNSIIHSHYIN